MGTTETCNVHNKEVPLVDLTDLVVSASAWWSGIWSRMHGPATVLPQDLLDQASLGPVSTSWLTCR